MSKTWKTCLATLALGMAALAEAAPAQRQKPSPRAVTTDTSANSVTVQNDRNVPVTVYLQYDPFDRRLGIVPALQTATLPLPSWAVSGYTSIQLFVHPENSAEDLETQDLELKSPARLSMLIPPSGGMPERTRTVSAVIPPEEQADATLTVQNPRATSVTVFAEEGDFDARLGMVPAHGSATLRFPKSAVRPDRSIQIFVHPEGGLDLASDALQVKPGAHLGLRVPLH